jgi:hypothetical protein
MPEFGKILIVIGIALVVVGALLFFGHLSWFGKLPGDVAIKKDNFSFYFPVTTCILLSVLMTLLFRIFKR